MIIYIVMDIYTENRPWGKFEKFHENQNCTVKLIYINSNSRLSLQYHQHRSEFWKIVKGKAKIEIDEAEHIVKENDNITIPLGAKHRITALENDCILLEISYGKFDEKDIIRIEDDYSRHIKKG